MVNSIRCTSCRPPMVRSVGLYPLLGVGRVIALLGGSASLTVPRARSAYPEVKSAGPGVGSPTDRNDAERRYQRPGVVRDAYRPANRPTSAAGRHRPPQRAPLRIRTGIQRQLEPGDLGREDQLARRDAR